MRVTKYGHSCLFVKSDQDAVTRCTELGIRGYFVKAHYTLEEIVAHVKKVLADSKVLL